MWSATFTMSTAAETVRQVPQPTTSTLTTSPASSYSIDAFTPAVN
jgi:hypothetical protein